MCAVKDERKTITFTQDFEGLTESSELPNVPLIVSNVLQHSASTCCELPRANFDTL